MGYGEQAAAFNERRITLPEYYGPGRVITKEELEQLQLDVHF